jgi:hypothetical protein
VDILPILIIYPIFLKDSILRIKPLAVLFVLLIIFSVLVQLSGALYYSKNWYLTPTKIDVDHGRLWSWRDSVMVRSIKDGAEEPIFIGYLSKKLTGSYNKETNNGKTGQDGK